MYRSLPSLKDCILVSQDRTAVSDVFAKTFATTAVLHLIFKK